MSFYSKIFFYACLILTLSINAQTHSELNEKINYKDLLTGSYFNCTKCQFRVNNIVWGGSKVEPHPMSIQLLDSLALVLAKYPHISITIAASSGQGKRKLDYKRAKYIGDFIKQKYNLENNITPIYATPLEEFSGIIVKFNPNKK